MPQGEASLLPEMIVSAFALALLIALVTLRAVSKGRFEVKLSDAIIAVIPVVLWLVISQRITKLVLGTEGITVETAREAIVKASTQPIKSQVPVVRVATAQKGGLGDIARLAKEGVEGLEFTVGRAVYAAPVVRGYLTTLSEYPFFKYVLYQDPQGRLVGMTDARKLTTFLRQNEAQDRFAWDRFADAVNSGNMSVPRTAPGFVAAEQAVARDADKRTVLKRMEELGAEWLPVVDANRRFVGVVERSRLTASLILDVADQLATKP